MTMNFTDLAKVDFDQKAIDSAFTQEFFKASGIETLESQLQAAFRHHDAAVAARDAARPLPANYPDAWDKHAAVLGIIAKDREAAICQALERADGPLLDFNVRVELYFEEEGQEGAPEGDSSSGEGDTSVQDEAPAPFGTAWLELAGKGGAATSDAERMAAFKAMFAVPDKKPTPAKPKAPSQTQRNKVWAQKMLA